MSIKGKIEAFIEEHLEDSEFFLVEIEQKGTERFPKLFIYLDGDKGITINDCAKVSKAINQFIDEGSLISTEYGIDVSSPGIDRPLLKQRQYQSNIGRKVKISLIDDASIEGKLISISENNLEIEVKKNKNTVISVIEIARIDQIKVLITF